MDWQRAAALARVKARESEQARAAEQARALLAAVPSERAWAVLDDWARSMTKEERAKLLAEMDAADAPAQKGTP